MDGSFVKGRVYKPQMGCSEDLIRGCSISLDTVRLFAFSRVSLTGWHLAIFELETKLMP